MPDLKPFTVSTEDFQGPLDKLLELIEKKQLDITSLSLRQVTGDFLSYLSTISQAATDNLSARRLIADFLAIASLLLLLKSKALLPQTETNPTDQTEDSDLDLTARLKIYRQIKYLSRLLLPVWQTEFRSYSRELLANRPPVFYPPSGLTPSDLSTALSRIKTAAQKIPEISALEATTIISIQEKVQEILDLLKDRRSSGSFTSLLRDKNRPEAVALFLALLHLIRDQAITAHQPNPLDDVIIKPV